jgi:hypothetical protein
VCDPKATAETLDFFVDSAHPSVQDAGASEDGSNYLGGGWTMRQMTIAVAVLLFGIPAHAGIITQTVSFNIRSHGGTGNFLNFNQLDPSLAPLNAVVLTVSATGYAFSSGITGHDDTFQVTNPTANTISFNAMLFGSLSTDAGGFRTMSTVPTTLGPHQSQDFIPLLIPSPAFQSTMTLLGDLSQSEYVGTGTFLTVVSDLNFVITDNSLISVTDLDARIIDGFETITYYYGSSFLVPEPASLVMLSIGLTMVAGLAWHRRRAA